MNKQYQDFRDDDLLKSNELAAFFKIENDDKINIEKWFGDLLHQHSKNYDSNKIYKNTKESLFLLSETKTNNLKFIIPKLINYRNIINSGHFKSTVISGYDFLLQDDIIIHLLKSKKIKLEPQDFLTVTNYLKHNYFVSPNGELLKNIFLLERENNILRKSDVETRNKIVTNILNIIKETSFHHDIIHFKKIVTLLNKNDIETIKYLKKYRVDNQQGCYTLLNFVLNYKVKEDVWLDFEIKSEIINLLDYAKGSMPDKTWISKLNEINLKTEKLNIFSLAKDILKFDHLKNYNLDKSTTWSDDIVKRFLKSSEWILKLCAI